jgi:hypothetical protein
VSDARIVASNRVVFPVITLEPKVAYGNACPTNFANVGLRIRLDTDGKSDFCPGALRGSR